MDAGDNDSLTRGPDIVRLIVVVMSGIPRSAGFPMTCFLRTPSHPAGVNGYLTDA